MDRLLRSSLLLGVGAELYPARARFCSACRLQSARSGAAKSCTTSAIDVRYAIVHPSIR